MAGYGGSVLSSPGFVAVLTVNRLFVDYSLVKNHIRHTNTKITLIIVSRTACSLSTKPNAEEQEGIKQ